MTQQEVKTYVDQIVVESNMGKQFSILDSMMASLIPYMLQGYKECREITQVSLGQLERISSVCVPFFFLNCRHLIENLHAEGDPPAYLKYVHSDWDGYSKALLDKVAPYLSGENRTFDLHMEIADALTYEERNILASCITDVIQGYGVKSQWNEGEFQNAVFFCNILYPICRKDNTMELLFHVYGNILDRLNTSGYSQHARDLAEGLLIIGYNENLLAEAYFSTCRAYTGANNVVAGLWFYYISLWGINQRGKAVSSRFAFDIYWQYLKICRTLGVYPSDDIVVVTRLFEKLPSHPYDRLSFYHTLYTARLMAREETEKLVDDVTTFLDQNREPFFRNLEHGSMPWISLILSMQEIRPNDNYAGLMPYVAAARSAAVKEGNEMLFDLLEGKNLRKHLKEAQYKLQETRNRSDYTMDNHIAMILAKRLLQQGYENNDVTDYLLAMSTKTDFSMVLPNKDVDNLYKRFDVQNVDGDKLGSMFHSPEFVVDALCADDNDVIIWIGHGKGAFPYMTLEGKTWRMSGQINVKSKDLTEIANQHIAALQYERETKEPGKTVYVKSDVELEEEGNQLAGVLKDFSIGLSQTAERVIFIKDIEIAAYPHHLFIDEETGKFVSALKPCCNALSTEVLFKTNTLDPLPKNFKKSFWIPYGSDEFTFDMIYGKLEETIQQYGISVQNTISSDNPLIGDLTMLCAHGATDISKTEVFYVDDKPLLDSLDFVGRGKVAVMFICHSGSISHSVYDSAMHTMVKRLILKGYSSVVAPMWSLPTDIITPWLNVFLESLEAGEYIIDAVFKANMKVKELFIAPSAWACLHLFGNPYTRVADEPRLIIEMKENK